MATVDQTMMKVQRILTGPMGLKVMLHADHFRVSFSDTSTFLRIQVSEWGKDDDGNPRSVVLVTAPLLRQVPTSPDLFEWIARHGGSRWFGHVEVHPSEAPDHVNLVFSHTLLGDYLDQPELETTMWALLSAANEWDDELKEKFGGKRTVDE